MKLNYVYKKTSRIQEYLHKLEVIRGVIDLLPNLPQVEENLRRKSLLKSSLYSARIEGNKLQLKDFQYKEKNNSKNSAKIEVFNILKALRWLYSNRIPKKLSEPLILKLHKLVMSNLTPDAGYFRTEPSAIFNQAGVAIYLTPPPPQVITLVKKLAQIINSSKESPPTKAAIYHFAFEKVHPFLDGNGRVGRILSTYILKNGGFSFRGLVSLEEFFENRMQQYYDLLTIRGKDITDFVEFFLEGLCYQAEKMLDGLKNQSEELPEDRLLPRRQEILSIIRDHQVVSFNFIKRRFAKIPESSLHYDLKKLIKGVFVKKLGTTRGVMYAENKK
ncbi:Fic family protein [Candidatus Roizmanbacteria bacterium]|nr:Fic family protein [Candidatus Roizmanbacteria bacterium]